MKKHEAESINHFPGFETGWYFPESLQIDKPLDIPGLNDAPMPSYEEYLASMQRGLANYAVKSDEITTTQEEVSSKLIKLPPFIFKSS